MTSNLRNQWPSRAASEKLETKKAVAANLALCEREHSPIKLPLWFDRWNRILLSTQIYKSTLQTITSSANRLSLRRSKCKCKVCVRMLLCHATPTKEIKDKKILQVFYWNLAWLASASKLARINKMYKIWLEENIGSQLESTPIKVGNFSFS